MNGGELGRTLIITPAWLWLIFGVAVSAFVVFSVILNYHWRRYRAHNRLTYVAELLYFIGGLAILSVAFTAITLF